MQRPLDATAWPQALPWIRTTNTLPKKKSTRRSRQRFLPATRPRSRLKPAIRSVPHPRRTSRRLNERVNLGTERVGAEVIQSSRGGVIISVRVIPRAGQAGLAGTRGDAILVRLQAPPVDGAANAEL